MMHNSRRHLSGGANRGEAQALKSAFRLLARRDHTEKELVEKLKLRRFEPAAVKAALERCRELGYVDDAKTALRMARQMSSQGNGPLKIRRILAQKGVEKTAIEKALAPWGDIDDQIARARSVLQRIRFRLARESDPHRRRAKAYRFLSGRGFPPEVIRRAAGQL